EPDWKRVWDKSCVRARARTCDGLETTRPEPLLAAGAGPEPSPRLPLAGKLGASDERVAREVEAVLHSQRVLQHVGGVEGDGLAAAEIPCAVTPLVTVPVLQRHDHPQI